MANGDVKALYVPASAEDPADDLTIFVQEVCEAAPGQGGLTVFTSEATLGAAYAGQSREDADMAGQSGPARVSFSLSIKDYQVRWAGQLLQGLENYRGFAKTQQAGNVGESQVGPSVLLLEYSEALAGDRSLVGQPRVLQLQQDDGGDDFVFCGGNSSVHSGDDTDGPTQGARNSSRTDLLLKADGPGGTDIPRVMKTP